MLFIRSCAMCAIFLLSFASHLSAESRPVSAFFIEKEAAGYKLLPPSQLSPWEVPQMEDGQTLMMSLVATSLYVGDLPDIAKNDVIFQVLLKSDTTTAERLGDDGWVSFSDGFDIWDDNLVGGYNARRLISGVPVDEKVDLLVKVHELDGSAKKKYKELGDLLFLVEDNPSGTSLTSAPSGNLYVQLAMEVFNLVYGEMSENDIIIENSFAMDIAPATGVVPLRPGQWLFVEQAKKEDYKINPIDDLVFDGMQMALSEDLSGKKMPTHAVLSIDLVVAPIEN